MPLVVLSSEQRAAAINTMDNELLHLLEEHHIDQEIIAVISHLHAKSIVTFAKIENTETDLRDWIINDIGIEKAGTGRGIISTLVAVWEMAKQRMTAAGALRAEAKAEGRQPELAPQAALSLRKDYQAIVGVLPDEEFPSEAYLNMKIGQLESGVLKAESLDEVTSKKMEDDEHTGGDDFEVDWSTSKMRLRRQKLQGSLPADTEELRAAFDLIKHCHGMLRLKHGGRPLLHGLIPEMWDSYVRFLLGKDIWGAKVRDATGKVAAELAWDQLLHFDAEARKWMTKQVNEQGITIAAALKSIESNTDLVMKHVTTALATAHVRGSGSSSSGGGSTTRAAGGQAEKRANRRANAKRKMAELQAQVQDLKQYGKTQDSKGGKGGYKGEQRGGGKKGKGDKGSGGADDKAKWLALARKHRKVKHIDGAKMCWSFNSGSACRSNCPFDHICAFCGAANHAIWQCREFKELKLQ